MNNRTMTRRFAAAFIGLSLSLTGCGGGGGLGPSQIKKREDRLKDELSVNWIQFNTGDFEAAIDLFERTLQSADALEGVDAVRNEVKSEAQNGIGWSFLKLQDLEAAAQAFSLATKLDRRNADAWVGWAGVSLAQRTFNDVIQFTNTALEADPDYNSATRGDEDEESGQDYDWKRESTHVWHLTQRSHSLPLRCCAAHPGRP